MAKYIQLKDRLTGEKEYPITSSAAILMKNGVGNLDDMILNAGKVKDVKVDGTSVVDANGIANIDIPQSITIDDSTNTITVGDKTIANILTKADLDDDIKDSANEAVKAATAHAVEDLVGKLEDLDVDADGAKDTPAPSNIVAAINDVAKNAGKIDKILANGTELTITDKKVDIPAATKDAYGLVKVDEALSDSSTNAVTNKAITSNTGLVSAVTENAAKSDGTATGTAPKDLAEAINNVAKNAGAISKVATTDGELTITDKKVTIPDATGTVKGLVNTTDAYDGTNGTKAATGKSIKAALETLDVTEVGQAGKYIQKLKQEDGKITATLADVKSTYTATDLEPISGKGVKAALDTLDVAEVGQAGKYIQKIKQEDGKIVATLADVKDTYTATDTEPISGKGVADMLEDLKLEETGGTDKIITMVKQEDGKVTATAKTAVEKVATPATTNAYEYKIADASVKVELPKATDAAYGEILLDKLKIDSASTAKTDDPKLMTGKAIEDSLAVKKVNGNASIYAYNATVPTVDNAIALGAGASVTAAGGVAVGAGAATASADDVAIGSGASTASDGSIAIGKSSTTNGAATIAIGETAVVAGQSAMAIGKGASAESTNAITIGTAAQTQKEGDIAIGTDTITDGKYAVAIGSDAYAEGESAVSIGKEANTTNKQAIAIGKTSATGKKSISIGNNNFATYEGAVAIGDTVRADNSWETALGTYNRSVEDDDPVVGTALTVGRGYPIDGDDPVLYNLLEQKQNADLYIPGIGGFDGKNSDPYDYELDEDGNPKINNDGNPIKKVRPLQESIVEDVKVIKMVSDIFEFSAGQWIEGDEDNELDYTFFDDLGSPEWVLYQPIDIPLNETIPTIKLQNADEYPVASGIFVALDDSALSLSVVQTTEQDCSFDISSFNGMPWADAIQYFREHGMLDQFKLYIAVGGSGSASHNSIQNYAQGGAIYKKLGEPTSIVKDHVAIVEFPVPEDNTIFEKCSNNSIRDKIFGEAIGENAFAVFGLAQGDGALAIGNCMADGEHSYVVGWGSLAKNGATVIGTNNLINGDKYPGSSFENPHGSILIGCNCTDMYEDDDWGTLKGRSVTSIGDECIAAGDRTLAIGHAATALGNRSIAIGVGYDYEGQEDSHGAQARGSFSLAIDGATADGHASIAIGQEAQAAFGGDLAIAIGGGAHAGESFDDADDPDHVRGYEAIAIGQQAHARKDRSLAIGAGSVSTNIGETALGYNSSHCKDATKTDDPDNTNFSVGQAFGGRNIIEIMQSGECYLPNLGGYDGHNIDSTNIKKNADGTDYINPLTNKTEKIVKPLQDIIELMDARIKYLEDIIDQLTQQRNPVEP